MRQYLKKNVFRILTFALLICMLPISATAACAPSKKVVYTEIVVCQPPNTSTEARKAAESAMAEAISKAEEAVKPAEIAKSNNTTPDTTEATNKSADITKAPNKAADTNEAITRAPETTKAPNKAADTTETITKAPETTKAPNKAAETTEAITKAPETAKAPASTNNSTSVQDIERQVVTLVNQARRQNGLNELTLNEELSNVARVKANDMANNKYFSHTSPTYGSPFDMMKKFGISYRTAGENIAMGQTTAQQVFDGWMNSEGHRANIMNSSFTQIGVGYSSNGHYWSQMFIG